MRRMLAALVAMATLITPASIAWAQQDEAGGSLAQRLIAAVDDSLGEGATVAVLRAYDRGYDLLQILEALFAASLATDGTIADEGGAAVAPSRASSGLIAGDGGGVTGGPVGGIERPAGPTSGEEIGLDVLERGVQKTSKRLDKKNDLGARADDYNTSLDVGTMLTVIVLMDQGYSPEQIIVDGIIENGIIIDFKGIAIRDAKGKVLRPDGVEPSVEDDPESVAQIAAVADDLFDAISGEDPLAAADDSFKRQFTLTIEVDITGGGTTGAIEGKANFGARKGEDGLLSGRGTGTFTAKGACSLSELDTTEYPYTLSAPLRIGVAGRDSDAKASLNIGVAATSSVEVTAGESLCLEIVRDTAGLVLQTLSIPDVTVRLRDGAQGNADNQDSGQAFTVGVAVRVQEI